MRPIVSRFALAVTAIVWASPACATTTVRAETVGPAGERVEDAVVFLLPRSGQRLANHVPLPASVAQHDREFVPYVTVVQTGAAVRFPNQDPIRHHVYSFSQPRKFEIKLYAGDAPDPIIFDKPGIVTMGCNVHDWMLGYVLVVDTPWFGKSGADGQVQINAVDDGEYEARIWHPRQRHETAPQHLKLAGAAPEPMRFVIEVAPRKPHYKPPLDPLHYTK
ncbi:MAG TPA: methylamine utilization protein [Burkholderiaceae bacterium]|jgi:plastocyanin|nr:methylamine utilization protein [Burkholderiaceae bacterium]